MKRLLSFILALLMLSSICVVAFADFPTEANTSDEGLTIMSNEPVLQEETEWYFRGYLGRLQMCLWSITYGYWLTDWIDVGPA